LPSGRLVGSRAVRTDCVAMPPPDELLRLARRGDTAALGEQGARLLEPLEEYPYYLWAAAIEADQHRVLALCLDLGLPADGPGPADRPLVAAAGFRARKCLELLVRSGADLDLPDEQGRVAL